MKRFSFIALALLFLLLCGCGGNSGDVPMTAEFAETEMTVDNMFLAEDSEYISFILFTARETVTDVQVYAMDFAEDGFVPSNVLYTAAEMEQGETLLGGVVFYGDMTTYGISFTDKGGGERSYELCVSGKDGSLIFTETT